MRKDGDEAAAQAMTGTSSYTKNVMFLDEDLEGVQQVFAVFKRASNSERLTRQQRMQNDFDAYTKIGRSSVPQIRRNPDVLITSRKQDEAKKKVAK